VCTAELYRVQVAAAEDVRGDDERENRRPPQKAGLLTKVAELYHPSRIDENVGGLDIPMHDFHCREVVQSLQDFGDNNAQYFSRNASAIGVQGAACRRNMIRKSRGGVRSIQWWEVVSGPLGK
jgi:hypothetical protein